MCGPRQRFANRLMQHGYALIHYLVDQLGDSLCPFMVS